MRVRAWRMPTDAVELEADVQFEDMLSAMAELVNDGRDCPNRLLGAIDQLTRILTAVEDEWIMRMKPEQRAEIQRRLSTQAHRYEVASTSESRAVRQ